MNRQKRLRAKKKSIGECYNCNQKARPNRVLCVPCSDKNKAAFSHYRKRCAARKKCYSCSNKARPDKKRCASCQKKSDGYLKKCRQKHVAAGKCGTCGKPREGKSTYFCDLHAENHRKWGNEYHKKNGGLTKEQLTERTKIDVIRRTKNEMGSGWNAEVAEFVQNNWQLFYDRLDPLLYKASEYDDRRDDGAE